MYQNSRGKIDMRQNKQLRALFDKLNTEFFNNEVKVDSIFYHTAPPTHRFSLINGKYSIYDYSDGRVTNEIIIHPALKKFNGVREKTMFHEMVHFYTIEHNNKFQKYIKRYEKARKLLQNKKEGTIIHNV